MQPQALNSIHLDAHRLAIFRQAREKLLSGCGNQTVQLSAEALPVQLSHMQSQLASSRDSEPKALPEATPYVRVNRRQRLNLKVGHNTIGRLPDNDIVAIDGFMSRRHCAILVHSNLTCELHDLASKNGTFLNGVRIKEPTPLQAGDEIQLGEFHLQFMGDGEKPAQPSVDHTCLLPEAGAEK